MARARGTAIVATVVLFYLFVILHCEVSHAAESKETIIHAATYIVGDEFGWDLTINMETWPRGKKFHAGDVLVFHYDPQRYNVVAVDKRGHDTCTVTKGAKVYESGDDHITLVFGANYFIDGTHPDYCPMGMKMAINATARPPLN